MPSARLRAVRARLTLGPGRVVVVSPHLDDAVLSLGATIARSARDGADVVVATVFANDPASERPLSAWDRECGFASATEAARRRREEDARACELLGATPEWLPFPDEDYADERDERDVVDALAPVLARADLVLLPGFPLANPDHAWLARTLLAQLAGVPLGLYVEQPYASDVAIGRGRSWQPLAAAARLAVRSRLGRAPQVPTASQLAPPGGAWRAIRPTRAERALKERAIRAHASQCEALGRQLLLRIRLHEAATGGEQVLLPPR